MKVVVTGGAGFVGSHLCDRLISDGHEVVAVDNLITGNTDNVAHLQGNPRFNFINHDVTQPLSILVDSIFHLASPASPQGYFRYPVQTSMVNSLGTYHLLELARLNRAMFLYASTSEIYGDPLVHPQTEDYWGNVNPIGVRSCYDEGKRFGESLLMSYLREYDLNARIIRIFNTFGPRSDPEDGRLVPNFIVQALSGEPITIYGDGTQTRSLCYVSDLVDGIARAMFTDGSKGEVFNLGNPEEHTVLEYAELIKQLCHSDSSAVHLDPLKDDPTRRRPNISKAKEKLGWEPRVPLNEGLEKTIDWFRSKL